MVDPALRKYELPELCRYEIQIPTQQQPTDEVKYSPPEIILVWRIPDENGEQFIHYSKDPGIEKHTRGRRVSREPLQAKPTLGFAEDDAKFGKPRTQLVNGLDIAAMRKKAEYIFTLDHDVVSRLTSLEYPFHDSRSIAMATAAMLIFVAGLNERRASKELTRFKNEAWALSKLAPDSPHASEVAIRVWTACRLYDRDARVNAKVRQRRRSTRSP